MDSNDLLDLHMTRLTGWIVRTVGEALLLATVIPAALVFVGLVAGWGGGFFVLAGIAGPLALALRLTGAKAPSPRRD